MEIRFKIDDDSYFFNFDHSLFINGSNKSGKTYLLKYLENGIIGEKSDFYINNNRVYKGDYKVIYVGDYNNFATDFKLTKSNQFKKIIYDEIINKINTEEMMKKMNSIFNIIDEKVNKMISESNLINDGSLKLNIEFDNIDKIIEKFTNIYIDDYLLDENKTPRSTLRKLLYNLVFYEIKNCNENVFVIIDDIDNALDEMEIKNIINKIENDKLFSNINFIVSSSRNIYSYVDNKANIYKIFNKKVKNIKNIDNCIKHSIILHEYNNTIDRPDFNSYIEENEYLINETDIDYFKSNILPHLNYYIGLMYCINVFDDSFFILKNELERTFLKTIFDNLIDNI